MTRDRESGGLTRWLYRPVDAAALSYFRVVFGVVMFWEVVRYFQHGWIREYWIEPEFHFHYPGFGWLAPLPGEGMYLLWAGLGVLALLIAAGLFTRFVSALFFLGFTYQFLLAESRYLNHLYLACLLGFLLIVIPSDHRFSLDAWRRPGLRDDDVPAWSLWLLRFQIGLPYVFGGVSKLNQDWMLRMEPMRSWLAARADWPFLNLVATEDWFVALANYGSVAVDLFVVPLLLWKRTRPWAFGVAVLFHLTNAWWFSIGIFPWLMIAATALFFDPSWPRRALASVAPDLARRRDTDAGGGAPGADAPSRLLRPGGRWTRRCLEGFLIVWVSLHLLLPLRHYLIPGDASWTEEGQRFAWRMMLRVKEGTVDYAVYDAATGEPVEVRFDATRWLASWQRWKLVHDPEQIRQFAVKMEAVLGDRLGEDQTDLVVRARTRISMNGRPHQPLVDPNVDLTSVDPAGFLGHADWIEPLRPLP